MEHQFDGFTRDVEARSCLRIDVMHSMRPGQIKKFDLKVAGAGTVETFVQTAAPRDPSVKFTGQGLLRKLEVDLEILESHLVDLNRYSERLTSEFNEKVSTGI